MTSAMQEGAGTALALLVTAWLVGARCHWPFTHLGTLGGSCTHHCGAVTLSAPECWDSTGISALLSGSHCELLGASYMQLTSSGPPTRRDSLVVTAPAAACWLPPIHAK